MNTSTKHSENDNLFEKQHFFFVGIGGIGMSALARYFHAQGKKVIGYDRTGTHLTSLLIKEGIEVHFEDDLANIPAEFTLETTQVIYTPAIPEGHSQLNFFKENGFSLKKRSRILGDISSNKFTVAVAGTHGKTTTSTMIAHLLKVTGRNVTAFLGGISTNYDTNYLQGLPEENEIVVVEADEFDRSFLTLKPDLAVISSVEADHLDIYGTGSALKDSFKEFASLVDKALIMQVDFTDGFNPKFNYSCDKGDYHIDNLKVENRKFVFDAITPFGNIERIELAQPGFHNVENALATIAIGQQLSIPNEDIRMAFESYQGVKRRFEWKINEPELIFIDDYAHHPTEIRQFIRSVKKLMPSKKLTAVFQPHLYSRTRDFAKGFSESLSLADEVILLDIYPAREQAIPGVESAMLLENITCEKQLCSKEELERLLDERAPELLVTMGAGDIDKLIAPIKTKLLENHVG